MGNVKKMEIVVAGSNFLGTAEVSSDDDGCKIAQSCAILMLDAIILQSDFAVYLAL